MGNFVKDVRRRRWVVVVSNDRGFHPLLQPSRGVTRFNIHLTAHCRFGSFSVCVGLTKRSLMVSMMTEFYFLKHPRIEKQCENVA
jgi:hypothetical protein